MPNSRSFARKNPSLHGPLALAFLVTAALLTGPALTGAAHAATFTVGADAACDFSDLPTAIFATRLNDISTPSIDFIHVANNQSYTGELTIQDQSVVLIGGFSDCSDTTPNGQTTIDRPDDERNLTIRNTTASPMTVSISSFNLTYSGSSSALFLEGGAVHVSGDVSVIFTETNVRGGRAVTGGGIFFDGTDGGFLHLTGGTSVLLNEASFGGGVGCVGSSGDGTVTVLEDAAVAQNDAQNGGGIYSNGCDLTVNATGFFSGIRGNEATGDGGGLYLAGSGGLDSTGGLITGNSADRGGGLFVSGSSPVRFFDSVLSQNHATTSGGGVHAELGAYVNILRSAAACEDLSLCAVFAGNSVDAHDGGAALALVGGTEAEIYQTRFADHQSPSSVIAVKDDSTLDLEGVVFVGNEASFLVRTEDTATLSASHISAVDNSGPSSGGSWSLHDNLGTGTSRVESSLIMDDDGRVYAGLATDPSSWHCLLLSDASMAPPSGAFTVGDADFIDRAGRNFRLGPDSDAIDFCDDSGANPFYLDRARSPRGIDDPAHADVGGRYDAGAFERVTVFTDGFESGDTSAWSHTQP